MLRYKLQRLGYLIQ